jgi:hypothetical protein
MDQAYWRAKSGNELPDGQKGELRVDVLDGRGRVLAASTLLEGGDHLRAEVEWEKGDMADLVGKVVRLRFTLRSARLYSYWLDTLPIVRNGDFEDPTVSWGAGTPPPGWGEPESYHSPARPQTGAHAIGGSGTSAYMPVGGRAAMEQSGLKLKSPVWALELDFASEDPPAIKDASSMYTIIRTPSGGGIVFMLKDLNDDGKGELHFTDGKEYRPVLKDAIVFDDDVRETPLVNHLKIVGHFDVAEPYYDVYLTDPEGLTHSSLGVRTFNTPVRQGESPTVFGTYTAWNSAAHLLDNVRFTVPDSGEPPE